MYPHTRSRCVCLLQRLQALPVQLCENLVRCRRSGAITTRFNLQTNKHCSHIHAIFSRLRIKLYRHTLKTKHVYIPSQPVYATTTQNCWVDESKTVYTCQVRYVCVCAREYSVCVNVHACILALTCTHSLFDLTRSDHLHSLPHSLTHTPQFTYTLTYLVLTHSFTHLLTTHPSRYSLTLINSLTCA